MAGPTSVSDFETLKAAAKERSGATIGIAVCSGAGCLALGAEEVLNALLLEVKKKGLDGRIRVYGCGCPGSCQKGPVVLVHPAGTFYQQVAGADAGEIISAASNGQVVERLLHRDRFAQTVANFDEVPFFQGQTHNILSLNSTADPAKIEDYFAADGYQALVRALSSMSPQSVIDELRRSGLRGRGGAGYFAGDKWSACREATGEPKYLVCNRSGLDINPHLMLEGILIAAYAAGVSRGFIYMRADNQRAVQNMQNAIDHAAKIGFVGHNILSTNFSCDLEIWPSNNAFICGEETAVLAAIEGRRAVPEIRPPFPSARGLWGRPTIINNAETFANVPLIVNRGADWFAGIGTEGSPGTKLFSLTGQVNNSGMVELPWGFSMDTLINEVGGGLPKGRKLKALQVGGPSGGWIPPENLEVPLDYSTIESLGAVVGSGELVVIDECTCAVDTARSLMEIMESESCGKCVPCRLGTKRMLELLTAISRGEGELEDLDTLESLAKTVKAASMCGLGKTAPNPVLTTLRHFRDEYEAHINDQKCPAARCGPLVEAPCSHTCPAGVDAPSYIALIALERYEEAVSVHKERNPFPSVCGRVCHHPCETRCRRGHVDESIVIVQLKRFMADRAPSVLPDFPKDEGNSRHKVGVIGSGPAGLSCAFYLALVGYDVTVFEALSVVGGMLKVGIPRFRLPQDVLDQEIESIRAAGVRIETGKALGRDFSLDSLFEAGFKSIFLGTGAHFGNRLGLEKESELDAVLDGVSFLKRASLGEEVEVGSVVAVIGGGNVALDAARTALRLGAKKVKVLYRRTEAEMPAYEWDIREAKEEGIELDFLVSPIGFIEESGKLTGVDCQRMRLGEPDAEGRRRPVAVEGDTFIASADTVISAIGQKPDLAYLSSEKDMVSAWGTLEVDGPTLMSSRVGVFGGGDAVSGPASVVEAVGHGQRAAIAIERLLSGRSLIEETIDNNRSRRVEKLAEEIAESAGPERREASEIAPDERRRGFEEVVLALTEKQALGEAARCLRCDLDED